MQLPWEPGCIRACWIIKRKNWLAVNVRRMAAATAVILLAQNPSSPSQLATIPLSLHLPARSLIACHKTFITFGISTSGLLPVRSCESLDTTPLPVVPLSKGATGGWTGHVGSENITRLTPQVHRETANTKTRNLNTSFGEKTGALYRRELGFNWHCRPLRWSRPTNLRERGCGGDVIHRSSFKECALWEKVLLIGDKWLRLGTTDLLLSICTTYYSTFRFVSQSSNVLLFG